MESFPPEKEIFMTETNVEVENQLSIKNYQEFLKQLREKIQISQVKAALSVNCELIQLYWEIGTSIQIKQKEEGWGSKTIDNLARDLKCEFPNIKGFSRTNINYMVQFAKEYPDKQIIQQLVGQIPWGHNIVLFQRVSDREERLWYISKTITNGWSRKLLVHWIDKELYKRKGQALTNFHKSLPPLQSDLAQQTLKDPYCFDFLTLTKKFDEKELENGLLQHIQKFLLELGSGFAFVGRQVELQISNQNFRLDLLFYHLKLRCFVVIELKAEDFKPEYVGKMNFYLTAVDETIKHTDDNPTIGLLLCKTKNKIVVEYALRDVNKPLGVAEYETKIVNSLPDNLKGSLPTIAEIEQELVKNE